MGWFLPSDAGDPPSGPSERTVRRVGLGCFLLVVGFFLLSITAAVLALLTLIRSAQPEPTVPGPDTRISLAFDARVGAGTLERGDHAGRAMMHWPVG